jgi:hypothetical protein
VRPKSFRLVLALVAFGLMMSGTIARADGSTKTAKLAELFKLTGLYESLEQQRQECKQQAEATRPQLMQQFRKTFPENDERFWQGFDVAFARFEKSSNPGWTTQEAVDYYATLFGAHLTEGELDQILAFYRSPVGKKDIEAAQAAAPEWRAFLREKNKQVFQKNYQILLKDLATIVQECSQPAEPNLQNLDISSKLSHNAP